MPYGWLERLHPDDRERIAALWRAAVASGENYETEFRLRRHDGVYRWFRTLAVPLRNAAGEVVKWFGSNTDIDDIKKAEEAARAADRRKDEFLATLAHELRNPLAPIKNGLQVMKMDGVDSAQKGRLLDIMARQADHLVRLVDDLLEASRISRGRIELRKQNVDLAHIVNDAVAACRPQVNDLRHDLKIALPPEPLPLYADPTRLVQALTNVLNNAAKFTPRGGRIEIHARRDKGDAVVSVRDNGVGIAAEMLTSVFDLFSQGDQGASAVHGGLGIGLALARSLVEMHGGSVEARSEGRGQGSEIIMRLPLAEEAVAEAGATAENTTGRAGRRVLVVDDDRDVADSFVMLLESLSADVRAVYDGRSAMDLVGAFRPDIVFLDLGMPDMDGFETARRIRQLPDGRSLLLVAMTGWGQKGDRRRTEEAGFDKHLVKPGDLGDIEALLT